MTADPRKLRPGSEPGEKLDPNTIDARVTDHPGTSDAEFGKASPKVQSSMRTRDANRWANMPQYPKADPWQAMNYLIAGVLLWGLLGYGAARWLDIPILTGVGIVFGGVLGIVATYIRYGRPQSGSSTSVAPAQNIASPEASPQPAPPDLPRASAPSRSQSAQRPPTPPPSDITAEEEKP
jgi:hypothetical protein